MEITVESLRTGNFGLNAPSLLYPLRKNTCIDAAKVLYMVSIKSFPDYKHFLQENYVEYKHICFCHYLS